MADDAGVAAVGVDERSRRDVGSMAFFLGFFGAAWFGWGQAAAPDGLRLWLAVGSVLAALAAAAGFGVSARNRSQPARMSDRGARRRYGIIVGIEFGVAGLGAAVLAITSAQAYIPAFVCAVVGVHFVPLAPVLADRLLVPLGAAVCAVAILALVLRLASGAAPSTVTGIGAGGLLTGYALGSLIAALAWRPALPGAIRRPASGPRSRRRHRT
jgi:hypothetical protein